MIRGDEGVSGVHRAQGLSQRRKEARTASLALCALAEPSTCYDVAGALPDAVPCPGTPYHPEL